MGGPVPPRRFRFSGRAGCRPCEARHLAREVVAAVEPVLELAQVSRCAYIPSMNWQVLRNADLTLPMPVFGQANSFPPPITMGACRQSAVATAEVRQAVAVGLASRGDVPAAPALDRLQTEAGRHLELDLARQPVPRRLKCRDERRLPILTALSFAVPEPADIHVDPKTRRYAERATVESVNARLKVEYGGRYVRVRSHDKILCHLKFGILALIIDQLLRLPG